MTTAQDVPSNGYGDTPDKSGIDYASLLGAAVTGDGVLDAAARCLARKGLDATSLDEVAVEAGVSRTTLYRRFGNREALFRTLIVQRAQPFRVWSESVLLGTGSPAERIERVLTAAILQIQRIGWLDASLSAGMSAFGMRVFKSAHAMLARQTMERLLDSLLDARARDAGVTVAELLDWLAEQMILLASAPGWDEAVLRHRLHYFVISVIAPESVGDTATLARLSAIEARLDQLIDLTGNNT
ncbi:TetR/AcrR family transcriptional regulator [Sphingomonas bacterium]|uniref:TetR/AcrR family transcriptional regulator n=1 Tax=Sphingomonas bacterium TaxID=1895847 RepID=UPI0015763C04|nr:TetR/AcrR family transcriptional regulator [Sphingomonas bacterium]